MRSPGRRWPLFRGKEPGGHRWRWWILGILGALAVAWSAGHDPTGAESELGPRTVANLPAPSGTTVVEESPRLALKPAADGPGRVEEAPIAHALRLIDECLSRYESVRDYTCTLSKRERIDGQLRPLHVMQMKVRTRPQSIYLKFRQPSAGREAIYVAGRNNGKVLAHDVGLGRLIAGTLWLDPKGARAMDDCRHPITEAGIGPLLHKIATRWTAELDSAETRVAFDDDEPVGSRPCTLIETTHPQPDPRFMFHKVRLYIDREIGLPIRFEAYDWPEDDLSIPALLEEYTYSDLKLNVGLGDIDFDVSNTAYAFGRF